MLPNSVDVVIVGSGAAALTAALTASSKGMQVAVLEKSNLFGGTSAVSGGMIWSPNNRYRPADMADSRDDALAYLRAVTLGQVDDAFIIQHVDRVNEMLDFVASQTGIEFVANEEWPDYQSHLPGGKTGGRSLHVGLFDKKRLGDKASLLRPGTHMGPFTKEEFHAWGRHVGARRFDYGLIAERMHAGICGWGEALIGELLEACMEHGVALFNNSRVVRLVTDEGQVTGVVAEHEGSETEVRATAVVLACGGFEWNPELVRDFLGVPMGFPASPPFNEGDGLKMAMSVGAALANMRSAWWSPTMDVEGETYDGQQLHRCAGGVAQLPGAIAVNRHGRRFANESVNYSDFGKTMSVFDETRYEYRNVPCYAIVGSAYRGKYTFATLLPDDPTPSWMFEAPTLAELAEKIGVDPAGLVDEVARFDEAAARGVDPMFHRGEGAYDAFYGDNKKALGPIGEGPYYAVEIKFGVLGTNGGPKTTLQGQVIDVFDKPIAGLYACGNVAASIFGPGYPGAGATLSAGMTMAFVIASSIKQAATTPS